MEALLCQSKKSEANIICKRKADILYAGFIQPPGVGVQYPLTVQPKAGRSENIYYFAK